jgi:hypothetical protein
MKKKKKRKQCRDFADVMIHGLNTLTHTMWLILVKADFFRQISAF